MERLFYEIVGADVSVMTLEMYKAGAIGVFEDTAGRCQKRRSASQSQAAVQHEEFLMALGIVHRGRKNAGS